MPETSWRAIRKRFRQTIPPTVTPTWVAGVLPSMSPKSATDNVIRPLRAIGLVDDDGKPTDRARRWRDDDQYPEVCAEILSEVYPEELLDLFPGPEVDRTLAARWFANKTGQGEGTVQQMVRFFAMLTQADPSDPERIAAAPPERKRRSSRESAQRTKDEPATTAVREDANKMTLPVLQMNNGIRQPSLHIDIQIHISHESDALQIDHIFASMAKHLRLGEPQDVE
ncbi:MAG TPA: DUF5343 domain-containing protein [Thermomicrobiales bacterium]|nr:DUF5343 domain-containing protein [Thermomicrobiales bacterium]